MTTNIGGVGLKIRVVASSTLPAGYTFTQFADDGDPFDSTGITIAETVMGLNGEMADFAKATPIPASINLMPNTEDDKVMQMLANANRVGKGKRSVRDVIQMTVMYPDGTSRTGTNGRMTNAMIGNSVSSAGRMKSKKYDFMFEGSVGAD